MKNLIIQSKTNGEVLYPYLAANICGSFKEAGTSFHFIDLNKNKLSDGYQDVPVVYIVISWVSIGCYCGNIVKLIDVVSKFDKEKIKIVCDDEKIVTLLLEDTSIGKHMLDFPAFIKESDLLCSGSDYTIANPNSYLNSIFLREGGIPVLLTYKFNNKLYERDLNIVIDDIDKALTYWKINSFAIEDCNWLKNSNSVESFLQLVKTRLNNPEWIILSGTDPRLITANFFDEISAAGCKGVAIDFELKDLESYAFVLPHINNFNYIAYIKVHNNFTVKDIWLVMKTFFLKTSINHYYYSGDRKIILNLLCFFAYLLSLTSCSRSLKLFSVIGFKKNNYLKIFFKIIRLFK